MCGFVERSSVSVQKRGNWNRCDMNQDLLEDGLEVLRREMSLAEVMKLIERTARWVDPKTFEYLPVWYPEHARQELFYKSNWSVPQTNTSRFNGNTVHKEEGNTNANKALTMALGLRGKDRPNWSCCHIWGLDDAKYSKSNAIVRDRRYYSCVANMVLLPTPLKAFTDVMPEVKAMLRICVANFYGWICEHESLKLATEAVANWDRWEAYPASWPLHHKLSIPLGVMPFTDRVKEAADRRRNTIRQDLESAGQYYPRQDVLGTLKFWNVVL
jgi:hypothetical protein